MSRPPTSPGHPPKSRNAKRFLARLIAENNNKKHAAASRSCCGRGENESNKLPCWAAPALGLALILVVMLRQGADSPFTRGSAADLGFIPTGPVFNTIKEPYDMTQREHGKMMTTRTSMDPNAAMRYRREARIAVCMAGNEVGGSGSSHNDPAATQHHQRNSVITTGTSALYCGRSFVIRYNGILWRQSRRWGATWTSS